MEWDIPIKYLMLQPDWLLNLSTIDGENVVVPHEGVISKHAVSISLWMCHSTTLIVYKIL